MEFRILGPVEVTDGDRVVALGGSRQRALLGMLLLHANEVVSVDRLLEELWPDEAREDAVKALQVAISRLRKALGGDSITTRSPGYELRVDDSRLDAKRFEVLVADARATADPSTARQLLEEALRLWRGPPLADLAYESFCQAEIARLREMRIVATEQRIEADLALGRHGEVVGELRRLVREEPHREGLRAQLMLALYRSGRQAEALEAYHEARTALVEELGIEPGRRLRELHQAILEQEPRLEPAHHPPDGAPGTFVGRRAEMAELSGAMEDAFAGRGRVVLLVGEPGIGKSRLAEELLERARTRGATVLVGRCWEAGGAPAYWPWVQSLREYGRDREFELLSGAAERDRVQLFDKVAQFLREASRDIPLVVFLDDMHAADDPSLLLLRYVAREIGDSRVLLVAAMRDVDPLPAPLLAETIAEIVREPNGTRLQIGGLTVPDIERYVELTAAEIASSRLVTALHEEAAGNPLFVGEIVRLLAQEGAPADAVIVIPQTVRDVIGRRVMHLSHECNRVLGLASVIGREFAVELLAALAGIGEDDLLDLLDEAVAARVVSEVPGSAGRLRFAHDLIRDTLYERLSAARRMRYHRRVTDSLAELYGEDSGPRLAALAHHALAGGDLERAALYGSRAGDRALALLAYEEAARHYRVALEAVANSERSDERLRCELLLALGDAELRAGSGASSRAAFLEAASLARRLGLGRELARAASGYGGEIVWGRAGSDQQLVPLLEEALAALPDDEVGLRVRLLARLAGALRDEPARDRRATLSAEAVELARRSGDERALAYALDGRASAIIAPDTVRECLAVATELRDVAARTGDRVRLVQACCDRCIGHLHLGEVAGAEADLQEALRIAEALRQPDQLGQVLGTQAMLVLAQGRLDAADDLIPRAYATWRDSSAGALPVYQVQRYTLLDFRGSPGEAERDIRELARDHPTRPVFRCVLAHMCLRTRRTEEARRLLRELTAEDCAAIPFDQECLFALSFLAEVAAAVEDGDAARVLYRLLFPWGDLTVVDQAEGIRGSAARYLGLLAAGLGRSDDADRHFQEAAEANERMGMRPWLARTLEDHGRLLAVPGLAERANALYAELGMAC